MAALRSWPLVSFFASRSLIQMARRRFCRKSGCVGGLSLITQSADGIEIPFKAIVATIDRWGLKTRFLRKHLLDVARFYKRISKIVYVSAAALKLKARLDKDRDKLFTFLSHDGVPWNNNNVEHAIKALARLRRAIEGLSTPRGIEEYLILLSVCQTCKYSGLDFLDFLRSGETDIGAFAASQR